MLISLFCFLQNSSARSCHISNIAKYHAVTIKKSEKKGNKSFYERKKLLQKHEFWMKEKFILRRKEKCILDFFG